MDTLIQQVARCIERERLATKDTLIYVAVSGGADSVALLTALYSLGYSLCALHCNFHLRGEESDRDELFVRQLCERLAIPCEVRHFPTLSYAEDHKLSIEMAARELRYEWFGEVWEQNKTCRIAIAHNSNDVTETFLYNLSQGTGIRGLAGIPYKRNQGIIRPLLDCTRAEILDYLEHSSIAQGYCVDSSNSDIRYRRNYIRHNLLPCFEGLKVGATKQIATSIRQLRGAEAYYRESIERHKAVVLDHKGICIERLLEAPDVITLLFEILKNYGFTSSQCYQIGEHIADMPLGASYQSASHRLIRSWDYLEILPRQKEDFSPIYIGREQIPCTLTTAYGSVSIRITTTPVLDQTYSLCLPITYLDEGPLCLRPPREGERMKPFGLKGSKRISRILIDAKALHREREEAIVLEQGDEILWLVGFTKSEATRIKKEKLETKAEFLMIDFCPDERSCND